MGNYQGNIQVSSFYSEINTKIKLSLYNHIVDYFNSERMAFIQNKINNICVENCKILQIKTNEGIRFNGVTYYNKCRMDWYKTYPLDNSLHNRMYKILDETRYIKESKKDLVFYIKSIFMLSKTFGDVFILLPKSFHNIIITICKDYVPGSPVTLNEKTINDFRKTHKKLENKLNDYILYSMLIK